MERAHELGIATAVPEGFELVYFAHVASRNDAEKHVHDTLARYRKSPKKEIFEVPLTTAIEALDRAAETFPIGVGRGSRARVLPQYFPSSNIRCRSCGKTKRVRQLGISVCLKCRLCKAPLPPPGSR